MLNHIHNNH